MVFAKDLAGNQSEKKVVFEIEGEKSFFQNLIQPKKEILEERKTENLAGYSAGGKESRLFRWYLS